MLWQLLPRQFAANWIHLGVSARAFCCRVSGAASLADCIESLEGG